MIGINEGKGRQYLEGKHADTTRALREHNLPGLDLFEAVEAVPRSQRGARQSSRLDVVEVPRSPHQARFRKHSILAQGSIENTSDSARPGIWGHGPIHAPLEEQGGHFVALLELSDFRANCDDLACAIRQWDDGQLVWVRVSALSKSC